MEDERVRATKKAPTGTLFTIATERGADLIRRIYRAHPYYAVKSETINELFGAAEAETFEKERLSYVQTSQLLFTIGYEGRSIEDFLNALIKNDVWLLCDVRKNPFSRKFGFSKRKLQYTTGTVGIEYVHLPTLGIDSEKRRSLAHEEDDAVLFREYEKTLPALQPQLDELYSLLCDYGRIALMCYEKVPAMCHRYIIRDYVVAQYRVKGVDL